MTSSVCAHEHNDVDGYDSEVTMPAQLDPNELVRSSMPLCVALGITGSEATAERVVLEMSWRADLCTIGGVVHGGALMALADSSGAVCAFLNLPPGAVATSTIESKTNFLGAVTEGKVVRAVSKPLHAGSTTIVVETELR
ncbi:MAG TPA: PaaI family thioesterase, partial [Ilumatobacteraceae bacterium]|nr:PaaI family thioesterase [Ilumatobacteraceae bacterium]